MSHRCVIDTDEWDDEWDDDPVTFESQNYDSVDSDMYRYAVKTYEGIEGFCDITSWNEEFTYTSNEMDAVAWYILEKEFGVPCDRPMPKKPPENDWQRYMQTKGYTESAKKRLLVWIMKDKIKWHNRGRLTYYEKPELKKRFVKEKKAWLAKEAAAKKANRERLAKEKLEEERLKKKRDAREEEEAEVKRAAKVGQKAKKEMSQEAIGEEKRLKKMKHSS